MQGKRINEDLIFQLEKERKNTKYIDFFIHYITYINILNKKSWKKKLEKKKQCNTEIHHSSKANRKQERIEQ